MYLDLAELGDNAHTNALVKSTTAEQALLVWGPVEAGDWLCREVPRGQQLHTACNTQLVAFVVLVVHAQKPSATAEENEGTSEDNHERTGARTVAMPAQVSP